MAHRAQAFGEDVQEVAAGEDGAFEALGAGAGLSVGSGNLFATVAADRAFPAAVAELGRWLSQKILRII
jgi:hypothetical protein